MSTVGILGWWARALWHGIYAHRIGWLDPFAALGVQFGVQRRRRSHEERDSPRFVALEMGF